MSAAAALAVLYTDTDTDTGLSSCPRLSSSADADADRYPFASCHRAGEINTRTPGDNRFRFVWAAVSRLSWRGPSCVAARHRLAS